MRFDTISKIFKSLVRGLLQIVTGFFIVLDCASLVCSVEKGNISQIHKDFQHFPENFIKIPNSYAIKT